MAAVEKAPEVSAEKPAIAAKLATITPELAEDLLTRNTHNRSPVQARIEQYAADMRKGDWVVNGEAIKISDDGVILDGQHRLAAICEAGVPVQTLIITGLPSQAQETMDQGRARSFGDALKLRGERDYFNLAAAVRIVALYERHGVPFAVAGSPAPTAAQLARTLERNPEIRDSVEFAAKMRRAWIPTSATAAMHYLFASVDQDDADAFFTGVLVGENLSAASPLFVLRERLLKEHYDTHRLEAKVKLAFVVRTWTAFRRGETITRLAWSPGGANPDKFPRIDGMA